MSKGKKDILDCTASPLINSYISSLLVVVFLKTDHQHAYIFGSSVCTQGYLKSVIECLLHRGCTVYRD